MNFSVRQEDVMVSSIICDLVGIHKQWQFTPSRLVGFEDIVCCVYVKWTHILVRARQAMVI